MNATTYTSANPYESPLTPPAPAPRKRWPKYWAFVLVVSFILGAAFGGVTSYGIGYLDGYQHCARKPAMPDDP
jgi:hypothetical protein